MEATPSEEEASIKPSPASAEEEEEEVSALCVTGWSMQSYFLVIGDGE